MKVFDCFLRPRRPRLSGSYPQDNAHCTGHRRRQSICSTYTPGYSMRGTSLKHHKDVSLPMRLTLPLLWLDPGESTESTFAQEQRKQEVQRINEIVEHLQQTCENKDEVDTSLYLAAL